MARPRTYLEHRDRMELTSEELRLLLDYNPSTGDFVWKKNRNQNVRRGDKAGHPHVYGYVVIHVMWHVYLAHRLHWLHYYGEWPQGDLDHANGIPTDNRIANLRAATDLTNARNRRLRVDNKVRLKGVSEASHPALDGKKWRARIRVDGKLRHPGYFSTPAEAHAAYCREARAEFGEFARFG